MKRQRRLGGKEWGGGIPAQAANAFW